MSNQGVLLNRSIEWGIACQSADRDVESGDAYVVKPIAGGMLFAVVDGLGHGKPAAEAAMLAAATVHECAESSIASIFARCHEQLKGTRGVVMSCALFNTAESAMTWAGVGNVEGRLIRLGTDSTVRETSLLLNGGVIGDRLPRVRTSRMTVSHGDVVILATDGIRTGFDESLNLRSTPKKIADAILVSCRRNHDDALVLVARYVGS